MSTEPDEDGDIMTSNEPAQVPEPDQATVEPGKVVEVCAPLSNLLAKPQFY